MAELEPLAAAGRDRRRWSRLRVVSVSCTVVRVLWGLFATVLVAWIVMVFGEVDPANGVAEFVRDFAAGVSLGFDDLFTPADAKLRVLLNSGLAAIVWLGIGALATMLIRRFAPSPAGRVTLNRSTSSTFRVRPSLVARSCHLM